MKITCLTLGMAATNVWFVCHEENKQVLITDPADHASRIADYIGNQGLKPVGILLTHGHFDHIMAVSELRERYRIPVYANEAELPLLQDAEANLSAPWLGRPTRVRPDVLLRDGEELDCGCFHLRMIATPGHTAGSCCYYQQQDGFLLSGDTLFADSYGRTDLPTGSAAAIFSSIRERLLVLPPETKVYPGHGDTTTIGWERGNFGR